MSTRLSVTILIGAMAASAAIAQPPHAVDLEPLTFPESVTSTADGTLLIGSTEKNGVYRAAPGAPRAALWIRPDSANGLAMVFGVLADEPAGRLWLCTNDLAGTGKATAIKAFDLLSGAFVKSYDLPGGGMCNDMAVDPDGTLYATDMAGRILRLTRGGSALEDWIRDEALTSADGIVVTPDRRILVNTFASGKLYAITPAADGRAGALTTITTPRPLVRPDGMRVGPDGVIYLVEGDGKASRLTLSGDTAELTTIADGLEGPTGITLIGTTPWVVEGKSAYRMDPALRGKDPGPFRVMPLTGKAP
ncbi:MAG TPA: SMP-30/gluconolactonase/LRE family protein [Sphingobium sp.]|nr:SMP-30/gluconolactonase/LRE family protein [Sphingobium sp.]